MEYLRNVGIHAVKPDVHICRMIGPERLDLTEVAPTPEEAYDDLMKWAKSMDENAVYEDNLLWLFAPKTYAAICILRPRCDICLVRQCNTHPSNSGQLNREQTGANVV